MANKKISDLPIGNLTSASIFPIVAEGVTSQVTFEDIQNGLSGGTSSGNSYVRGWETDNEIGNSINLGKGIGKITLTQNSNAIIAVGGANLDGDNIGSAGYNNLFTVILSDGTRRYIEFSFIDSTNGTISSVYYDNQSASQEDTLWIQDSGDYEYYPYFISEGNGDYSFASGNQTQANGQMSTAQGGFTKAGGAYSNAQGYFTLANGNYSLTQGFQTITNGSYSFAGGYNSQANGEGSFVFGQNSNANGNYVTIFGVNITGSEPNTVYVDRLNVRNVTRPQSGSTFTQIGLDANGFIISGSANTEVWEASNGYASVVTKGAANQANGSYSVAEGSQSSASGQISHAEGQQTQAIGAISHAEGQGSIASGQTSHSEGFNTIAGGGYSHAQNYFTQAIGQYSHAEGDNTIASGQSGHAGGSFSYATGNYSFVHGYGSQANGESTVVLGSNITGNTANTTYVNSLNIKELLSLNIASTAGTLDGQIWLESNTNTGLKIRINGVTKTITLS